MKYPTASSAQGGGGTNMTRTPAPASSVAHKGTMGSGQSNMRSKGTMGSGSPGMTMKGVQGGPGNHEAHSGVIGSGHPNAVPAKNVMGRG